MTFGQPLWFWAMAILPLLTLIFVLNERRRGELLRRLVAARLQDRLAGSVSVGRRRFRFALLMLGLACVIAALAQPRLGFSFEQSKRQGHDVIIAIDCSRSMLATDLPPTRLARAKLATQDLIGQLKGDRVGLVAFAGSAFLQAPLTVDYGAVLTTLAEFDTEIIPRGGTNIAAAIKEASEAFGKGEGDNRSLIIFTDGEELYADAVTTAEEEKTRMKIFTVGLGAADGSLIPLPAKGGGTAFVRDENGEIVRSKLDEERLRKIAESTGGFYVHLDNGPAEMQQIVQTGLGQMKEKEIDIRMSRRPIERYQWPLAAGLALIVGSTLIGERKRAARRTVGAPAVAALAALGLLLPYPSQAKNGGVEAYDRKDYKGAAQEFDRQLKRMPGSEALHFNLGAAAYKSGNLDQALDWFAKAVTTNDPRLRSAAEYNIGNTLFQRGVGVKEKEGKIREWKGAIQHYEEAIKVAPENKNAQHNRDLVQRLLHDLEHPPEPPDQQQQQQQQEKKDDEKKDQEKSQSQDKKDGDKKDQDQQKDSQSKESKDSQAKDQQGKDQQQKDQQQKDQQAKPEQGKDDQSKDQKQDKGDEKKDKDGNDPKDGKDGKDGKDDPAQGGDKKNQPLPKTPDRQLDGDIQAQNTPQPQTAEEEAAAEAQAAEEGRMTEAQARAMLESLKGEDKRLPLLKPGEKKMPRPLRDW